MNRGIWYLALALACLAGMYASPWWLKFILAWVALSSLYFTVGYFSGYGELLMKSEEGRLPLPIKILLFPILLGCNIYNWIARHLKPAPPLQEIRNGLWLGRLLSNSDKAEFDASGVSAVLDVTVEFDSLSKRLLGEQTHYLNIPVFDHMVPRMSQLVRAVHWLDRQRGAGREVLVHCALGQGRSVTVLLAYLLYLEPKAEVDDLLREIQRTRTIAEPNSLQLKYLREFAESEARERQSKTVVVFNPVAGTRDPQKDLTAVRALLEPFLELEILETSADISAETLTQQAIENGATQVIAAGGDGTVIAVASQLVGRNLTMGIIPRGTANALAVCLYGEEVHVDPINQCCRHILAGTTQAIDVARYNDQFMLLLAGIGMERGIVKRGIVERTDRTLKSRWGALAYLVGGWLQLQNQELFQVIVDIDGTEHEFTTGSLTVANAAPNTSVFAQGGGPPAIDDGELDITVIVDVQSKQHAVQIMAELFSGAKGIAFNESNIRHFRGKTITLDATPPQKLVVDGEVVGFTPVTFETLPKALRVAMES